MNSNQRSQGNNQSDNGGNVKKRDPTVEKDNLNQSEQSGTLGGSKQGGQQDRQGSPIEGDSIDRSGSQTGSRQQVEPGQRQSNDLAGGLPKSPSPNNLSADEDMDDDTGLSNRANRQSAEPDQGNRQMQQSNVGRRDDGTPD